MLIVMIGAYIIVTVLDTYKLFKNREYGKLAIYYSIILVSVTIGTMVVLDMKVPSPADPIAQLVKSVIGR